MAKNISRRGVLGWVLGALAMTSVAPKSWAASPPTAEGRKEPSLQAETQKPEEPEALLPLTEEFLAGFEEMLEQEAEILAIGVDHGMAEQMALQALAHPRIIKKMKAVGIPAALIEVAAPIRNLYENSMDLPPRFFEMVYRDAYPNQAPSIMLQAEQTAFKALTKEGLTLIPYDRRFGGDLKERSKQAAESNKNLEAFANYIQSRRSPESKAKEAEIARLEGEKAAALFASQESVQQRLILAREKDPTYLDLSARGKTYWAEDVVNCDSILREPLPPSSKRLVFMGDAHLVQKGALADLLAQKGKTLRIELTNDCDDPHAASWCKKIFEAEGLRVPDFFLGLGKGGLSSADKLAPPPPLRNLAARFSRFWLQPST